MEVKKDHFKTLVSPLFDKYIHKENYNENKHSLVKKMVENLDNICMFFLKYIDITVSDTYLEQLESLTSIAKCLENIISLDVIENENFKIKIKELLDFRNIPSFDKKKIYELYVNKCLIILIEYMVALNILSLEQSKEYLKISSVGFVPI